MFVFLWTKVRFLRYPILLVLFLLKIRFLILLTNIFSSSSNFQGFSVFLFVFQMSNCVIGYMRYRCTWLALNMSITPGALLTWPWVASFWIRDNCVIVELNKSSLPLYKHVQQIVMKYLQFWNYLFGL